MTRDYLVLFFIPFFALSSFVLNAQSEFNLIGGQQVKAKLLSESETHIEFEITKKNGKTKVKKMEKERLFSVVSDGLETIYYNPETGVHHYTVEDMRMYVYGQQDAYQYYKTTWSMVAAAAVGAGAGLWMGTEGSAVVVLAPVVGTIAGTVVQSHAPKPDMARSASYLKEPAYVLGFKKTARGKKVVNSIKSAVVGSIVGGAIGFGIYNSK